MRVHRRALHAVSRIGSTWESFFEPAHRVHVTTPATTSNLGPGFDSFGMAMDMSNEVIVEHADEFSITILGEGVNGNEHIPANEDNVIVQSCYRAFEYMGKPVPPLRFECHNTVPALRGLGSSSSALVAGLAAGFALGGKEVYAPTVKKLILQLAADIEGHADNISAAIYGGLQVNFRSSPEGYARSGQWITQRVHLPSGLHCVLYIPDHVHQVARNSSRGALPELYTRSDCVHNIGRAAMLINCFATGQVGPSPPPHPHPHPLLRMSQPLRLAPPSRMPSPALTSGPDFCFAAPACNSSMRCASPWKTDCTSRTAQSSFRLDGY